LPVPVLALAREPARVPGRLLKGVVAGADPYLRERTLVRAWSGYGTQAAQLVPRLISAGHDVAVAAFHGLGGAPLNWQGVMVYPGSTEDMWAQDVLKGHYDHHQADLVITIMDAWVMNPDVVATMNAAHWLPIDCSPLSALDRKILEGGRGHPVAMSEFGRRQLADAGFPAFYAPHAIDTSLWAPDPGRDATRRELGLDGKLLIGINAANQDPVRKGFAEQFEAFAVFREAHPEALLLVNARAETKQGLSLGTLAASLGLDGACIQFCDQYLYAAGLTGQDKMARWYGLLDVLSNCSFGEGFGLPVLEAQSCGTPVVVTDCSAMSELCGAGWLAGGQRWFNKGHEAWWVRPSVPAITQAYEEAFALWQAGGLEPYREKARTFALGYDADLVLAQHWVPALKELCAG
jgi:glycosyltransferase involved in cell wall biosynthesis